MKFGIYTNLDRDSELKATRKVIASLHHANCPICYDEDTALYLGIDNYENASKCDILLVLGGDGTILRAARKYVQHNILLAGINVGNLGFMSEIGLEDVSLFIDALLTGDYVVDERMMLEAFVPSQNKAYIALNDVIVTRQHRTKMMQLDLHVNGVLAENYYGDGVIIATPTGSTAYSLSAGGPVISPSVNSIVITPICPHSLYARSIVVRYSDIISIHPYPSEATTVISIDGQQEIELAKQDIVKIRQAEVRAKFARLLSSNFFAKLKQKLAQWNTPIGKGDCK